MAGRGVELEDKLANWSKAFTFVADSVTPNKLRDELNALIFAKVPADPETGESDPITLQIARINGAMALARLVSANDRAAATVAALLVQSGIKPAAVDYGDDT